MSLTLKCLGGSILTLQEPTLTTAATRNSSYSILVAADDNGQAQGDLYLDDGVSLEPSETKLVSVSSECAFASTFLTVY